ncbi:tape measure protein, partial [Jeotgalibaca porci]|uniref:tape measure protein n=1 Tax=Jeotgalibaca porci TaxID=1868793 RepID=UPI0035A13133
MTSLEASLKLRDKFTSVLRTIDDGLKRTTKSMENLKDKATGPAQALNKMTAAARQAVDKLNSSIKSGMDKAASVVQTSTARILTLFGSFGNGISKTLKLDVVSNKFSSFFGNIKKSFDNLTGKTKKNNAIADIEKQLDRLQKKETKIQLNIDKLPTVQKKIESINNRLDRLSNAKADIVANVKNADVAEKRLEKLDKHVERLNNRKTVLQVEVDKIERAKTHLGSVKKEIDELNAKKIELNTTFFTSSVNRIKSSVSTAVDAFNSLKSKATSGFNGAVSAVKNGVSKIGGFLKQSGNAFKEYGNDMKNAFDKMKSSASSAGGGFKSMVAAIGVTKAIGVGINALTNGVKSMVGELSAAGATWQVFEGNMSMLGKTDKEIGSVKKELQQFAQQTIYSASDMASTYSQLAAVGVKNTTKLVKGFGGLAAASEDPAQAMKTLSQQATQMAAKPAVQWADFKLMLEQTPAGIAAIAKTMGMTTSQLVSNVQEGTIKTQDFFDAITETGNNKAFTKMATQFKTVGQAMDGLKEGLTNKLQPTFDKVSAFGIEKISQLADYIDTIDFDKAIGDMVNRVKPYLEVLKTSFNDVKQPVMDAVNAIRESLGGLKGEKSNIDSFKGFMESVVDVVTKLAGFAEKHSDSIAKLIDIMPKLALAFVGFKIGKGVLTPLLNFSSGLFGITKATGKLAGGLGKAFGGLFKKMPKDGLEVPGTGKKGAASALNPVGGLLDTLNSFAKGASGIALAFGVIKLIEEAAQALKDINDKVPSDLSSLAPKLLNMSIAVGGMTAFVKSMGKFASLNTKSAIGGMLTVAGISANLMLAAEAMKQVNDKVPSNIADFAPKIANIAIAIGGMAALAGALGAITASGIGALVLAGG